MRLFLLELLIYKIHLDKDGETITSKDLMSVNVRFSEIINMDITPENFPMPGDPPLVPSKNMTIDLNMGKTYLFAYIAKDLITELKSQPLELIVQARRKPIGTALVNWKSEFFDMVKIYESIGVVKSVDFNGSAVISEENGGKVGSVDLFMRMSCFGVSIETDFRVNPFTEEFIFMNSRTTKTFKVEGFDMRSTANVTPVSSIYYPALNVPTFAGAASQISWTELFGGSANVEAKLSVAPMAVDDFDGPGKLGPNIDDAVTPSASGYDVVSMIFRPPENKFFDFLNMVTAEVTTNEEETLVTLTIDKQPSATGKKTPALLLQQRDSDSQAGKKKTAFKDGKKDEDDPLEMTADKIARKLCKNKDCPAAKKFKEYGIGPLATGPGLGTLYNNVEPPVSYGLSHTYGTMANYGPYGVFTRPKDPNQPFIPRKKAPDIALPTCPNTIPKPCCGKKLKLKGGLEKSLGKEHSVRIRLRGGGSRERVESNTESDHQISTKQENALESHHEQHCSSESERFPDGSFVLHQAVSDQFDKILEVLDTKNISLEPDIFELKSIFLKSEPVLEFFSRLQMLAQGKPEEVTTSEEVITSTGTDDAESTTPVLRLRGGGPVDLDLYGPKSPFLECKPVMDQFDQILAAYKKALGPCGEASCPYAQNLTEVSCKKLCEKAAAPAADDRESVSCDSIPCSMESCPYKENKNEFPAGCGSPKCAYTKYKLGLVDDDAALELQFLPPAISGKCGHPKCDYPFKYDLPPIHWDCPDPLPKGNCKNPDCPFLPRELKALKRLPPKCPAPKRGPCGSINCPYALPSPCALPSCPFRQKPCPFLEDQLKNRGDATCDTSSSEEVCENPDCPFAKDEDEMSACYEDLDIKGEFERCENPNCPFAGKSKEKKNPKKKDKSCAPEKKLKNVCGNPDCPYASEEDDESECFKDSGIKDNLCENPKCPFAKGRNTKEKKKSKKKDDCCAPKKKLQCVCGNPDCPFATEEDDESPCSGTKKEPTSCGNPKCPFAEGNKKSKKKDDGCASDKKLKSLCGNPDCPFAIEEDNESECFGDSERNNQPTLCGNPKCPFAEGSKTKEKKKKPKKKTKECSVPKEPSKYVCRNPECPFVPPSPKKKEPKKKSKRKSKDETSDDAKGSSENCDNPECPSAKETKKEETDSICGNPNCPYAAKKSSSSSSETTESDDSSCENPDCPYAPQEPEDSICNDPYCPYAQPLPSCGIPNCPYEPVPILCRPPEKTRKPSAKKESFTEERVQSTILAGPQTTMISQEFQRQEQVGDVEEAKVAKKKRKKRGKFVYSTGDRYPGVKVGHKECVTPIFNVPPRMGWLWNIHTPMLRMKPRRGWKPGAIVRTIANRIRAHRQAKGLGMLKVPKFRRGRKGIDSDDDEINVTPKPTLHIQKKEGSYWITMNPLKDPKTLADNEDPYMECTPMQFRITKNKQKQAEGENDSKICCCEGEEESSSSDSELDIEFTPPAGIIHPERFKKKKNVVHCDTQYDTTDYEAKKDKAAKGKGGKKDKKGKGKGGKGKGGKGKKGKGKK